MGLQTDQRRIQEYLQESGLINTVNYYQLGQFVRGTEKFSNTQEIIRYPALSFTNVEHILDLCAEVELFGSIGTLSRGRLKLEIGDESVEWIVMPHRGHERIREVNAHLPVDAFLFAPRRFIDEPGMCGLRKFD